MYPLRNYSWKALSSEWVRERVNKYVWNMHYGRISGVEDFRKRDKEAGRWRILW